MSFLDSKLYRQACAHKLGKSQLPAASARFSAWLTCTYGVNLVYPFLDTIDTGPAAGRPRLLLFLETAEDIAKLEEKRWILKPSVREAIQRELVAWGLGSSANGPEVLIGLIDFSREAIDRTISHFLKMMARLLSKELAPYGVWKVTGFGGNVVVFYLTCSDVHIRAANGTSKAIARRCYDLARHYDRFGYLTVDSFPIAFDSKENLDANYQGSEFYYFR